MESIELVRGMITLWVYGNENNGTILKAKPVHVCLKTCSFTTVAPRYGLLQVVPQVVKLSMFPTQAIETGVKV